jgi:hypothetical protein
MVTYLTSCPKLIGLMVENHNNNNNIRMLRTIFLYCPDNIEVLLISNLYI